ncbi:MAG: polysaccharide biosynthesis protein [Rhodospirillales bacterium]|nr:polysaccharide biosynthesis protein [Rhodospirillales bacterium]
MAAASFVLSLYMRLGDSLQNYFTTDDMIAGGLVFTAISAAVFWFMGLYRGIWRYASLNDLIAIARAVTIAVLVFLLVMFVSTRLAAFPRSFVFINWFVLIMLLGAPRMAYRMIKDRRFDLRLDNGIARRVPVLLVGAEDGAEMFIRAMARARHASYQVVGIVSEDQRPIGRRIHGIEVQGTIEAIPEIVAQLSEAGERPQRLIVTKDTYDGALMRSLLTTASGLGMTLARLPSLTDFKSGVEDKIEVRPLAVEDLLGRPQTPLDRAAMGDLIRDKRVLVTGAGGCIGSELVRQTCAFGPAALLLLDNSEYNLYTIDLEVSERHPAIPRQAVIADARDRVRILRVFSEFKPDIVFHAAALKHVPLVEHNVIEGALTNVVGTMNVADACIRAHAGMMVQVSTDKAVNPSNVMGATKRIAEQYCQALDLKRGTGEGTRFITVRFGNVLGSTGSVVPLFQKQLAAGGPLTVTHPEMKRFFMTMHEAVELILQASALGATGITYEGKIFVLDMGEPVRILDLARQMIRLAGFEPEVDIKIEITGARPGEKLSEEIFHGSEPPLPTSYKGILVAGPRVGTLADLVAPLKALASACDAGDAATVLRLIADLVPEYVERTTEQAPPRRLHAASA